MPQLTSASRHVFIDESGDPDIKVSKQGTSRYFVLAAVIVDDSELAEQEELAGSIAARYFPGGELKSSRIGGNTKRRKKVMEDVSALHFRHYSQVIDKSAILKESGLRFRRSFVKYINRALYSNLFQSFSDLHVIADEYGRSDFMEEFASYLQRRLPRLFERHTFKYGRSEDYPLIQIADFVAGTISRCYSGKGAMAILEPIREHTIIIDEWPPRLPSPLGFEKLADQTKYDRLVRKRAVDQAQEFIDRKARSDDFYEQAQVAAVRYLLYHFRSVDPEEHILTADLRGHLEDLGYPVCERLLRSRVIGKLRDEEVFIVGTNKGIKIPHSVSDLHDFVSTVNGQVVPYLNRLKICRKHFMMATNGDLDIVDEGEYPELYRYLSREAEGSAHLARPRVC